MRRLSLLAAAVLLASTLAGVRGAEQIASPDGMLAVTFQLQPDGTPAYRVQYAGQPVLLDSRLGLQPDLLSGFSIVNSATSSHDGQWTPLYGERRTIPDHYRQLDIDLAQASSGRRLHLAFRAYEEGVALRYSFPPRGAGEPESFRITGERTEFHFPDGTFGYEEHATEGDYRRARITDIQPWCERPLTVEYASGLWASLGEADNQRYPRMLLSNAATVPGEGGRGVGGVGDGGGGSTLVSALGGATANVVGRRTPTPDDAAATLRPGEATPWRYLILGRRPGDLLERDYLLSNLCPPPDPALFADTSWIKPGKVMRDTALTTANSKAIVDFAAEGGFQYLLWDARWYGPEAPGDATTVRAPHLDMSEVLAYAASRQVGLMVYVDRRQMKEQRDILFPLYERLGIRGVKIGFVDVGPQAETAWITETLREAARHHLMINIHDGYRSTGIMRTYPNLMTVEGIQGNEHMPTAEHNCTLPYTRFTAGAADYTICYYSDRIKTTHAHQLALAAVYYSPLTWLYWYDRPAQAHHEPELEFFRRIPTTFDDTKVLDGAIGQYASVARRSGEQWFVGTINTSQPRQLRIPLSFLAPGKSYVAHVYADDPATATATRVGVSQRPVDASTVLDVSLPASGGQALWIGPAKP